MPVPVSARLRLAALASLIALVQLAACGSDSGTDPDPDPEPDPDPPGLVGPAGGTVFLADSAVQLVIPSGALSAEVEVTATPIQSPARSEQLAPGTAYRLGPDGLAFSEPARLTIRYDPDRLPAGSVEEGLALARFEVDAWQPLEGDTVDDQANTVSGEIDGFSDWGVSYERVPVNLSVATTGEDTPIEYPLLVGSELDFFSLPANGSTTYMASPGTELLVTMLDAPLECMFDPWPPETVYTVQYPGASGGADPNRLHWDVACPPARISALQYSEAAGFTMLWVDTDGDPFGTLPLDFVPQWQHWASGIYDENLRLYVNSFEEDGIDIWSVDSEGRFPEDPYSLRRQLIYDIFDDQITPSPGPRVLDEETRRAEIRDVLLSAGGNIWRTDPDFGNDRLVIEADYYDLAPIPYFDGDMEGLLFNRIGPDFPDLSGWLMFYDPATGMVTQLLDEYIYPWDPVAPGLDGGIVLTMAPNAAGYTHLWQYFPQDGDLAPLTEGESMNFSPSVHHTGRIAFISNRSNEKRNVFTMHWDGSGLEQLTDSESTGQAPYEARFLSPREFRFSVGFRFRTSPVAGAMAPAADRGADWIRVPDWVRDPSLPPFGAPKR